MLKKKKTFLTSLGALMAFVGLRWLSWALHWPSLAAVGLRGLRSNKKIKNKMKRHTYHIWWNDGLSWPALAVVGLALAFVGRCGPALAVVGCCGPSWAS